MFKRILIRIFVFAFTLAVLCMVGMALYTLNLLSEAVWFAPAGLWLFKP